MSHGKDLFSRTGSAPKQLALVGVLMAAIAVTAPGLATAGARSFEVRYRVSIGPIPEGEGPIDLFIPIAQSDEQQQIKSVDLQASVDGEYRLESVYNNRFWHARIDRSDGQPIVVTVKYLVERKAYKLDRLDRARPRLSDAEKTEHALFLKANARVAVGDPILQPILAEVRERADSSDAPKMARAIYDWVVENMEYKKVGTGWGNGDTHWACSKRYGNCTDFHSLYISLARTMSIPARFEMGFPVPDGSPAGEIGGYHCWVQFYLPDAGWVPIDASEASKHPEKKDFFYGTHGADRIRFTTGRDLRLGEGHSGLPLNYFIYPYVELRGEPYEESVKKKFSYRNVGAEPREGDVN
jgi:transglutaminase-like putative cysteine protease